MMRVWGGLLGMLVLFGCSSEADYSSLNLVDVTGKVTLDGSPLAGARVAFHGADGHTPIGITDSAGVYKLMYDSSQPGCTPGEKVVRITTGSAASEEGADPDGATEEGAPTAEPIPAKFNRQSTLKAHVTAENRTFNWDLHTQP
jgi:hypothetical protein